MLTVMLTVMLFGWQGQVVEKAVGVIVNAAIDIDNKTIFRELGAIQLLVALLHDRTSLEEAHFDSLDTNRDGVLSTDEFMKGSEGRYDRGSPDLRATTITTTTPAAQLAAADALCNLMHNNTENQVPVQDR